MAEGRLQLGDLDRSVAQSGGFGGDAGGRGVVQGPERGIVALGAVVQAGDVGRPLDQLTSIEPDAELWTAFEKLDRDGVNQLPVTRNHHMIGMLSRDDVISFLRTLQDLAAKPA